MRDVQVVAANEHEQQARDQQAENGCYGSNHILAPSGLIAKRHRVAVRF